MRRITALLISTVLMVMLFAGCTKPLERISAAELLDLGEKYLLEMNYEQAVVYFGRLIVVEPMNPRGYTGLSEAYMGQGDVEKATEVLEQGLASLPGDAEIQALLDKLLPPQESSLSPIPNSEPTPLSAPTPESTHSPHVEGSTVSSDFQTSNFTYSFIWEDDWGATVGTIGGCYLYATVVDETGNVYGVLLGTWSDHLTNDMVLNVADFLLPQWKEYATAGNFNLEFSGYKDGKIYGSNFPIRQEDLGKEIEVVFLAFDSDYEYLGKIILDVQVPANPS